MSDARAVPAADQPEGILYAGTAYVLWGIAPIYWRQLVEVPPAELAFHRVFWCALCALAVTAGRGRLTRVISIVREPRIVGALMLTSVLITSNWTIFIWGVASHQLVEASLGYYLTPLLSIGFGVVLLGEHVSAIRLAAIGLASLAVVAQAVELAHVPWLALSLALTFGIYGYVRKLTPVDSLDGLTVETCLLFPLAFGAIALWGFEGTGAFPSPHAAKDLFLIGTGPLTAVPLVLFAAGARRVRMTTLGFLQYLGPSLTLLMATTLFGEPFTRTNMVTFGCVWGALMLVALEGRFPRSPARKQA